MVQQTHTHPKPLLNRFTQFGAVVLATLMLVCVPLLVILQFTGAPGGLFILTAIVILILIPPVLMVTSISPDVTLGDEGIILAPLIWRERFVHWDDVTAVKTYPLMPSASQEVNRRNFVGRKNYIVPDGFMLVIPSLPLQYRIAGFFTGESGRGVVALTNRTHTNYDALKRQIIRMKGGIQPHA